MRGSPTTRSRTVTSRSRGAFERRATCSTTWVEIDDALRRAAPNPFPIGRAKPYAEVFLQDGEICVAGDHVMRGYINRPDLNQTLLFRHNGKRAYHTGDLGQIDEHGLVTFRGRIDDQRVGSAE